MIGLTQVQDRCLDFLKDYSDTIGMMPTFDEIRQALGLESKSSVFRIMNGLEDRGAIRRAKNVRHLPRAIEIVPESERRTVLISQDVWALLIGYCAAEQVTIETAVAQFVRDGLESA